MARRAQNEAPEDSLDLFLSTSCDSFGGIVFITLLVCLLPAKSATEALVELERSREKITQIKRELPELEAQLSQWTSLKELEQALREKSGLQQRDGNDLKQDVSRAEAEAQARLRERDELKIAIANSEKSAVDVRQTRLPRLHKVEKQNYYIVLCNGKVYLPIRVENLAKDNDSDFELVTHANFKEFKPRPEKGTEVSAWLKAEDGARSVREHLPRDKVLINIVVYPDSIAGFDFVRGAFTSSGYDYNWVPMPKNNTIKFAIGNVKMNDAQ